MLISLLIHLLAIASPASAPSGQTMSAIRMHDFGPPGVLKLEDAPRPAPGEGELLVRVCAASVNPVDWKIRSGAARGSVGNRLPYTPGFDVSGVVEQVGANVAKFKPGDEIFALLDLRRAGAYAQFCIVKETEAATKPAKASHVEAAAVPLVALTAWQALFDSAHLDAGQTVLIHAGAGGVGSMAVQLAKWKGAHVIATASKDNLDFLKQIGADEVIDYREQKLEDAAKDVDVVLDSIGGETQAASWKVLKPGGILVSIVGPPSQQKAKELGVRAAGILVRPNPQELSQIAKLIDDGKIKPIVTHVLPLSDAAKAHELSESRHTRGKIVLEVQTPPHP